MRTLPADAKWSSRRRADGRPLTAWAHGVRPTAGRFGGCLVRATVTLECLGDAQAGWLGHLVVLPPDAATPAVLWAGLDDGAGWGSAEECIDDLTALLSGAPPGRPLLLLDDEDPAAAGFGWGPG